MKGLRQLRSTQQFCAGGTTGGPKHPASLGRAGQRRFLAPALLVLILPGWFHSAARGSLRQVHRLVRRGLETIHYCFNSFPTESGGMKTALLQQWAESSLRWLDVQATSFSEFASAPPVAGSLLTMTRTIVKSFVHNKGRFEPVKLFIRHLP